MDCGIGNQYAVQIVAARYLRQAYFCFNEIYSSCQFFSIVY
jgi:hypothetical protein